MLSDPVSDNSRKLSSVGIWINFSISVWKNNTALYLKTNSCIEIYAHGCLKPFSIGRKPCSNSKTHVQIMKFTCRLNMGFGRRHWSMRRDVMRFVLNKMADVEETPRFSVSFYVVNAIFKRF